MPQAASTRYPKVTDEGYPTTLLEHLEQFNAELCGNLQTMLDARVRPNLVNLMKSFKELRNKIISAGSSPEILDKLRALQQETRDQHNRDQQAIAALHQPVATGTTPAATLPQTAITSHNNVVDLTNVRDPRKITLKLENGVAMNFRHGLLTPNDQARRVNEAIICSDQPIIKDIRVAAVRQLKSGDLEITLNTIEEANNLTLYSGNWTHRLGEKTSIYQHTYGIIVHSVRTSLIGDFSTPDSARMVKEKIVAQNLTCLNTIKRSEDISYIEWLSKKRATQQNITSLAIELREARQANECIKHGIVIDGEPHACVIRDRNKRVRICYRCWRFGHITTQCMAPQRCGRCSEKGHKKENCPKPPEVKHCCNCKGPHAAYDEKNCPIQQQENERVRNLQALDRNPQVKRLWPEYDTSTMKSATPAAATQPPADDNNGEQDLTMTADNEQEEQ
jgi:hypothetical protein